MKAPIKITHCGHSYCDGCLNAYTRGADSWACPKCRRINNFKVEDLARNFDLEQLVDSLANIEIQPNQNAELGLCDHHQMPMELRKSKFICVTCKSFLFADLISECLVHGNALCYECFHDRVCGGATRDGCQTMKIDEFQKLIKVGIYIFFLVKLNTLTPSDEFKPGL